MTNNYIPLLMALGPHLPQWFLLPLLTKLLLSTLVSSLSDEVLAQVVGLHTTREGWTTLEQTFSLHSQASVMKLRLSLASSMKGNISIPAYFQKMKSYAYTLATIDWLADYWLWFGQLHTCRFGLWVWSINLVPHHSSWSKVSSRSLRPSP